MNNLVHLLAFHAYINEMHGSWSKKSDVVLIKWCFSNTCVHSSAFIWNRNLRSASYFYSGIHLHERPAATIRNSLLQLQTIAMSVVWSLQWLTVTSEGSKVDPVAVHARFKAVKVTLDHVFFEHFGFPLSETPHPRSHVYLSTIQARKYMRCKAKRFSLLSPLAANLLSA
jgi:hypothetical protein